MAIKKNKLNDIFARGGNAIWYDLNMIVTNLGRIIFVLAIAWIALIFGLSYLINGKSLEVLWIWSISNFWITTYNPKHPVLWHIAGKNGVDSAMNMAKWADPRLHIALHHIFLVAGMTSLTIVLLLIVIVYQMIKKGKSEGTDSFLRGQHLNSADELAALTKADRSGASNFQIGDVPIPKRLLMRNFLFVGSMGTGKSQGQMHLMESAREQNLTTICYDPTGEFCEYFYRPETDFILNPLDARCASWNPFLEIQKPHDFLTFGRFFIPYRPSSGEGAMWDDAARQLMRDLLLIEHRENGGKSTLASVSERIRLPLDALCALLAKHKVPSAATMNSDNPKGSESIRLTLGSSDSVALLELFDQPGQFSVRNFTKSQTPGWIFITSNAENASVIRPWSAVWLEAALLGAMGARPVQEIKTVFFLDELASLPRLRSLEIATTQGRKYGICTVVGLQNLAQADETYGKDAAKVMVSNLQTKVIMRVEDAESAKRLADILGQEEIDEVTETANLSLSENESHGQNTARARHERYLVTPSQILAMPDMAGYMKVAGDYPIAKIVIPLKKRTIIHPDFIDKTEDVIHATHKKTPVDQEEKPAEKGPESTPEAAVITEPSEAGDDSVVTPSEESEKPQADLLWW